jgi:DNA repair exonuclease SbcCD ATPase subunit
LLKIFPYSLFGKVEGLNKQRIVNWKNRKNAEAYISFIKGNNTYSIHRGIKPDILEVYENSKLLPLPASKTDLQNQIEKDILEMDYKSFMNIVYADLNNSQSVLTMSKPQKRQFLEQIFDLEYYTKLKDTSNKKINIINSKIESLNKDIEHYNKEHQDCDNQISKFNNELNNIGDSSEQLQNKQSRLEQLKTDNEYANKELPNLQRQLTNLNNREKKVSQNIVKIKYKIKYLNNSYIVDSDQVEDIQQLHNQRQNLLTSIQSNEDFIEQHQNLSTDDLLKEKEQLNKQHTTLSNEIKRLQQYVKDYEYKLDNKTDNEICPTCFQKVDHEHIKDHLHKEINESNEQIKSLSLDLQQVDQSLSQVEQQLSKTNDLIQQYHNAKENLYSQQNQLDNIDKKIQQCEEFNQKIKKSEKYQKVIEKLNNKLQTLYNEQNEINNKVGPIEEQIEHFQNIQNDYLELNRICENLKTNIQHESKQKQTINNWIKEYKDKQSDISNSIDKCKKEIKKLKSTLDYVKVIKDLCDDKEAKSYTLSNKVPVLNQRVNYYLNKAGVNYYVKLDNFLETEIRGPGIKDCSFDNLSGAERISLMESMRFAFNDINRLQSTTHLDLLILDEIIGSNSLDNIGVQNLMNIVKTKQEEDNSNVLIVSHAPNIGEFEHMIDNFYTIQYDGSYSQIVKN